MQCIGCAPPFSCSVHTISNPDFSVVIDNNIVHFAYNLHLFDVLHNFQSGVYTTCYLFFFKMIASSFLWSFHHKALQILDCDMKHTFNLWLGCNGFRLQVYIYIFAGLLPCFQIFIKIPLYIYMLHLCPIFFQSYESPSGHITIIYHHAFTLWRISLPLSMWPSQPTLRSFIWSSRQLPCSRVRLL